MARLVTSGAEMQAATTVLNQAEGGLMQRPDEETIPRGWLTDECAAILKQVALDRPVTTLVGHDQGKQGRRFFWRDLHAASLADLGG